MSVCETYAGKHSYSQSRNPQQDDQGNDAFLVGTTKHLTYRKYKKRFHVLRLRQVVLGGSDNRSFCAAVNWRNISIALIGGG